MNVGIKNLLKVLNDENRQKIILLIKKHGPMSYTRLLEESEIFSTGLLNYHLKVIGDLLEKNDLGEYTLTEKGKIALRLLEEFPQESSDTKRLTFDRKFVVGAAIINIINLTAVTALYLLSLISYGFFIATAVSFAGALSVIYIGYRYGVPPKKIEKNSNRLVYITLGATISLFLAYFGTAFLSSISTYAGGPNLLRLISQSYFHVTFFCLSLTALGTAVSYLIGERRAFTRPKWVIWVEEHFPY